MRIERVILLVLDGVGIGALPDAESYGDAQAATLPHVARAVGGLNLPALQALGLGNICSIAGVPAVTQPGAAWGRMAERSAGKDSVTGHWELAGLVRNEPFAVFPAGFPSEIVRKFAALAGRQPLGNYAASGTDILDQLGAEHLASGRPIIYTSSDSVFQIAAHEEILPPEQLYSLCARTLEMLIPYGVCRVIARPFIGTARSGFTRTARRHDFPVAPTGKTLLDRLQAAAVPTCGVGKIGDLFNGRGLDSSYPTQGNSAGIQTLFRRMQDQAQGLIFANLVDFDMLYGHRLDSHGFARAVEDFDREVPVLLRALQKTDLLLITADHGCDPTTTGTDHSREYVPLLACSATGRRVDLGTRTSFADVAATLCEIFALPRGEGQSFLPDLCGRR